MTLRCKRSLFPRAGELTQEATGSWAGYCGLWLGEEDVTLSREDDKVC